MGSRIANYPLNLTKGPDIVAVNRTTGKTVILEAKGNVTAKEQVVNLRRMRSEIGPDIFIENSIAWLTTQPNRYLTPLQNSADPDIQRAATLLNQIVNGTDTYETIIFGSGLHPSLWGNGLADVFEALDNNRITSVEFIKQPWPDR
ncbi:MAG: hypothetical protein MI924_13950 [Chloroflexales bacterium]|nr:hypothetical protein [Chloroflexales bacterium]